MSLNYYFNSMNRMKGNYYAQDHICKYSVLEQGVNLYEDAYFQLGTRSSNSDIIICASVSYFSMINLKTCLFKHILSATIITDY